MHRDATYLLEVIGQGNDFGIALLHASLGIVEVIEASFVELLKLGELVGQLGDLGVALFQGLCARSYMRQAQRIADGAHLEARRAQQGRFRPLRGSA
jgi:hypothetical protein